MKSSLPSPPSSTILSLRLSRYWKLEDEYFAKLTCTLNETWLFLLPCWMKYRKQRFMNGTRTQIWRCSSLKSCQWRQKFLKNKWFLNTTWWDRAQKYVITISTQPTTNIRGINRVQVNGKSFNWREICLVFRMPTNYRNISAGEQT